MKGRKKMYYSKVLRAKERYNVKIYRKMPEGWKVTEGAMTAPCGLIWINNGKSLLKGERVSGFLLDERGMKWVLRDTLDNLEKIERSGKIVTDIFIRAVEELQVLIGVDFQTAKEMIEEKREAVKKIILAN